MTNIQFYLQGNCIGVCLWWTGVAISFNRFLILVYESFLLDALLLGCVFVFLCEFIYARLSWVSLSKTWINQHIQGVSKGKDAYEDKMKNTPALKDKIHESACFFFKLGQIWILWSQIKFIDWQLFYSLDKFESGARLKNVYIMKKNFIARTNLVGWWFFIVWANLNPW